MRALSTALSTYPEDGELNIPSAMLGAIADVAEELQNAVTGVQFHHRGLDVDDVGAGFLRVTCQLQAVLRR